jgi:hypothetical protein
MKRYFAIAALALVAGFAPGQAQPSAPVSACAPAMGLNFVCGMKRPEDLLQIGSSKYIVFGGSAASGGVGLIDSQAMTGGNWISAGCSPITSSIPIVRPCRIPKS